jgi:hypothetical protein
MRKFISFLALVGLFQLVVVGQDCKLYYPEVQNAQMEYKNFDKKNKLTGSSIQRIKEITRGSNTVSATVEAEYFDNKGASQGIREMTARCENGVFYFDMKNYLNQESLEGYNDMEMKVEGGSLELPSRLNVGDVLKAGDMKIIFSTSGTLVMTMTINISNRKVDAFQDVITDAGTFKCYKISYDIATKMLFNIKAKGVEYYNEDIGVVKSESYTTAGDMQGYMVLSSVKK